MRTRSRFRLLAVLAAGLLALGLSACGDDDDAADTGDDTEQGATEGADDTLPSGEDETRPAGDEGAATITATDNEYDVDAITAAPGATVSFVNSGSNPHTVTADDGAFDTGTVPGGSDAELTAPSEPGTYAFHCDIHASMTATLTVE